LLLSAGAATTGISVYDCSNVEAMSLLLAGGAAWSAWQILVDWPMLAYDDEDWPVITAITQSEVPLAAKKRIERAGFGAIRARVLEICIALQQLEIPAPQLIEIVTQECEPFAARLPYHYLWDAVVLVKHFRSKFKFK
jgi:hypothetical protein